jgi:proteasome assembly chaperone (PAC2) family protein
MQPELRKPWLIAVWPGMGGVAQIAGTYLARQLGAEPVAELDPRGFFDVQSVAVKGGLVQSGGLPRSVFYAWRHPGEGRDLLLLLGERQPSAESARYSQALLEIAEKYGVERVFTFAAMATPIHPTAAPRVFAVASGAELLPELLRDGVTLLDDGEITGLNGVFIGVAASRGLPSVCLLGEFPFFAAPVPNPKASAAVLKVFSALSGVEIDLSEILADARKIEQGLSQHLEGLQRAAELAAPSFESPEGASEGDEGPSKEVLERIERLFAQARSDRSKALELKAELDRQGLFRDYEDRFLDLFKQAG